MDQKNKLRIGDVLKAEFELYIDGEKQEKYCKTSKIELGKDKYFEGLDNMLLESEFKHEMTFDFKISDKFENAEWANKTAKIKIKALTLTKKNKKVVLVYPETNKYEEQIKFLNARLNSKELEIKTMMYDFQDKAKTLQKKAGEEIQKAKSENELSLQNEKNQIKMYAMQSFLEDFITPYNNFLLALNAGKNSSNQEVVNYVFGFNMINRQLLDLFADHKIHIISPLYLEKFNPEIHHAIDFIQTDEFEENTIAKLSSHGLILNDRVIKPALVVIYKKLANK